MKLAAIALVAFLWTAAVHAQHGGKAEPKRIEFPTGRSSTTLTGSLSNGREMDFVFSARKGQKVTLKMDTRLFDYRVYLLGADFDTEFDSSPTSTIELSETADYLLFVRKKITARPTRAVFKLLITIQ